MFLNMQMKKKIPRKKIYSRMLVNILFFEICFVNRCIVGVHIGRYLHLVLQKLLPWLTRLKEADMRTLMVGKFYHAHSKIIIGTEKIHLMVVEYQQRKYLILESEDQLIKQRIEIRTRRYHNQTILSVKVKSKRTSAIFQYTVGRVAQHFINEQLEKSLVHAAEIYSAVQNELRIPKLIN